jgi:hypothetical protein
VRASAGGRGSRRCLPGDGACGGGGSSCAPFRLDRGHATTAERVRRLSTASLAVGCAKGASPVWRSSGIRPGRRSRARASRGRDTVGGRYKLSTRPATSDFAGSLIDSGWTPGTTRPQFASRVAPQSRSSNRHAAVSSGTRFVVLAGRTALPVEAAGAVGSTIADQLGSGPGGTHSRPRFEGVVTDRARR